MIRGGVLRTLVLLLPAAAGAVPTLTYETLIEGDPPLERPAAVTLAPGAGSLCVTDGGAGTLDVFDSRGFHRFRTDRSSGLSTPGDGCLDDQGRFVFTDAAGSGTRTIKRLNFLGEPEPYEAEPAADPWSPRRLSLAADGGYLTVDGSGLLAKHDAVTGALLWKLALAEPDWERADLLGRPGVAPDGTIYVPDAGLGRIIVVPPDGSSQSVFGTKGVKRGELAFPVAVAFAPGDLVLVLDQMKHVVIFFDREHGFLSETGRVGKRPGDFYNPVGMATGPDGRVYVCQGFEGRIQVFRLEDAGPR
jgi:DNA-binding beta-propeller fold protein YncE